MSDTKQNDAVARFLSVWGDGMLAGDIATSISCTEVEALAGVFEAFGQPEDAQGWREAHAEDDDEGDMHNPDGSVRSEDEGETLGEYIAAHPVLGSPDK